MTNRMNVEARRQLGVRVLAGETIIYKTHSIKYVNGVFVVNDAEAPWGFMHILKMIDKIMRLQHKKNLRVKPSDNQTTMP